jgi:hypothetical protein
VGVGWAAGFFVKDYKPEIKEGEFNLFNYTKNIVDPYIPYPLFFVIVVAVLTGLIKNLCDRSPCLYRIFGFLVGKVEKK